MARQQALQLGWDPDGVGWGVTSRLCVVLQLGPQHQPWAYSVGLLQEPCEQGGDADAGGPGNVLTGEPDLGIWVWGLFWFPCP